MKETSLLSPSETVRIVIIGRKRYRWQLQIHDRLVAEGRGEDQLLDALSEQATRGDRHGEDAVRDLSLLAAAFDDDEGAPT